MPATISLTDSDILTVLRSFILSVLPTDVEVVQGQANRVAEPQGDDFVMMWPVSRSRLATNIEVMYDTKLMGTISGYTLTCSGVSTGALTLNSPIFAADIPLGVYIQSLGTGTGQAGTYVLSQSIVTQSTTFFAGVRFSTQKMQMRYQCDVHGPNGAENSTILTTLLRSEVATDFFQQSGYAVTPLFADDATQMPFMSGENQAEDRWTFDVVLQADPVVMTPQQFADSLQATPLPVDIIYPPLVELA
jgi:hypothetical protein